MISSTQGGWTILSSEGRYMGSAAWGDGERLTNPYYRQLREVFHFANDGTVRLNRALANWPRSLQVRPYTTALLDILVRHPLSGCGIPMRSCASISAVETVDAQERFDKAAATQLVFEDALFHIIGHLIRDHRQQAARAHRRHGAECDRQHAADGSFRGPACLGAAGAGRSRRGRSARRITLRWRTARRSARPSSHLPLRRGTENGEIVAALRVERE